MAATFAFPCQWCGAQNTVGWERGGKPCLCQHCGVMIEAPIVRADLLGGVPVPEAAAPVEAAPPSRIKFRCSQCRHLHRVDVELSGEVIACENCGSKLRVPPPRWLPNEGAAPAAPARPAQPKRTPERRPARPAAPIASIHGNTPLGLDRFDLNAPVSPDPLPPPQTFAPRPDSVFVPSASDSPGPVESPGPIKKRKRKKKRYSGTAESQDLGGFFSVLIFLGLVVSIAAIWPEARMVVGAIMGVAAPLVFGISLLLLLRAARLESEWHQVLCFFVPFYMWYYVLTRWEQTRSYFLFYVLGFVLFFGGGAMILWGVHDLAIERGLRGVPGRPSAESGHGSVMVRPRVLATI